METLLPSRPLKEKAECHLRAEEQREETGGGSAVVLWAGPTGSAHGAEVPTPLPPGADFPLNEPGMHN